MHIAADGGANRIYNAFNQSQREKLGLRLTSYIPELIQGDLDSLSQTTHQYYLSKGSQIVRDACQDTTDFMKCLSNQRVQDSTGDVYVLGALSGRFDHTMASLNVLFLYSPRKILLVSEQSIVFLLNPGENIIECNQEIEGPACGLFPLTGEARVTTTGLKWNLNVETPMRFGGLISTSNGFENEKSVDGRCKITVVNDIPILWTCQLRF